MHQSADVLRETESNPLVIILFLMMTKNLDHRQNKNHTQQVFKELVLWLKHCGRYWSISNKEA